MAVPNFGRADRLNALAMKEQMQQEVLGTIPADSPMLDPEPQGSSVQWSGPSGDIALEEGPPPWELEDNEYTLSDARRYVDCPPTWTLRWINPRLLESSGWQDWKPVTLGDPRVKAKVLQMVTPDGNIRRGGSGTTSDILAYMPTHWVESRRRIFAKRTSDQTQKAVNTFESLKDEFGRSGLHLDSMTHPTHTQVEGRSIRD